MKALFVAVILSLFLLPLHAKLSVGDTAPPLGSNSTYNTKDGKGVNLKSYRGQLVLIDFWATWCGPCVRAMPHIQELHEKYGKKGLVVIAHTNKTSRNVKGYIKDNKYSFIFSVGKDIGNAYGVRGIPHAFLLDTKGRVLWHGHSASIPEDTIKKQLKNVKIPGKSGKVSLKYPEFKRESSNSRIRHYVGSVAKGRIGYSLKGLEKLKTKISDLDEIEDLDAAIEILNKWIEKNTGELEKQVDEGMVYEAHKVAESLSKSLTGHDKQKVLKKLTLKLRNDKAYRAGKEFHKMEVKMARKSDSARKKSYLAFSEKYKGTYYAKKAEEMAGDDS